MAVIRVVLADDHPIWLDGVEADLGDGFEVVAKASSAPEAIAAIEAHGPDLVVCDLHMPGGGCVSSPRPASAFPATTRSTSRRPTWQSSILSATSWSARAVRRLESSCSRSQNQSETSSTRWPPERWATS